MPLALFNMTLTHVFEKMCKNTNPNDISKHPQEIIFEEWPKIYIQAINANFFQEPISQSILLETFCQKIKDQELISDIKSLFRTLDNKYTTYLQADEYSYYPKKGAKKYHPINILQFLLVIQEYYYLHQNLRLNFNENIRKSLQNSLFPRELAENILRLTLENLSTPYIPDPPQSNIEPLAEQIMPKPSPIVVPKKESNTILSKISYVLGPFVGIIMGGIIGKVAVSTGSTIFGVGIASTGTALLVSAAVGGILGLGASLVVGGLFAILGKNSSLIKQIAGSLSTILGFAGIGATIGSLIPIPVLGTIIGAAIGLGVGLFASGIAVFETCKETSPQDNSSYVPSTPLGQLAQRPEPQDHVLIAPMNSILSLALPIYKQGENELNPNSSPSISQQGTYHQ